MIIGISKLDLALARSQKNARQLRPAVSQQTMQRIYKGKQVKPATVGKLAYALGVGPAEIIEKEV